MSSNLNSESRRLYWLSIALGGIGFVVGIAAFVRGELGIGIYFSVAGVVLGALSWARLDRDSNPNRSRITVGAASTILSLSGLWLVTNSAANLLHGNATLVTNIGGMISGAAFFVIAGLVAFVYVTSVSPNSDDEP
jgi:hypothetical protein